KMKEMPEPEQADLFLLTHRFLVDHGLPGYEVLNFARGPEHRSRHNQKYWNHIPYLGLGPSAHSFSRLTAPRRWWNERKLRPYEMKVATGERPVAGAEELAARDLALEALMLGFRTAEGINLARFRDRYGLDLRDENSRLIERLTEKGLLTADGDRLL